MIVDTLGAKPMTGGFMRKQITSMLSVGAVVAGLLFALSGVAGATPSAVRSIDGPYLLQNYNGYCMDIGSNNPGTVIGIWHCNANFNSQRWYFESNPDTGATIIRNRSSNLCMDLASNSPGTVVGMWYCDSRLSSQQWGYYFDYSIHNSNGLCQDLGSNAPGTPVVMANCGSTLTSQIWYRLRV